MLTRQKLSGQGFGALLVSRCTEDKTSVADKKTRPMICVGPTVGFLVTATSADMLLRQLWHCFLGHSEILF